MLKRDHPSPQVAGAVVVVLGFVVVEVVMEVVAVIGVVVGGAEACVEVVEMVVEVVGEEEKPSEILQRQSYVE